MAKEKLTPKQEEELFLDLWYELAPETYDDLFYHYAERQVPEGGVLISDCADMYPKLYKKLLDMLDDEAKKRGLI